MAGSMCCGVSTMSKVVRKLESFEFRMRNVRGHVRLLAPLIAPGWLGTSTPLVSLNVNRVVLYLRSCLPASYHFRRVPFRLPNALLPPVVARRVHCTRASALPITTASLPTTSSSFPCQLSTSAAPSHLNPAPALSSPTSCSYRSAI